MSGENTAEYQTVLRCGARIKQAVRSDLTNISDLMVGKQLITPDNGGELRNRNHTEPDRASRFLELLQSAVKHNVGNYQKFVDKVLGENYHFYRGIIDHLDSEYDKIKDELSKLTVESTAGVEERTEADSGDTVASPKETEIPMYDIDEAEIDFDLVPGGSRLQDLERYARDVQLILHTVNDKEIAAVLGKMQPPDIDGFEKPTSLDAIPTRIVLGKFGGYKAAQVNTEMGADCAKDLKAALTRLPNARTVIAVGVAYGSDRNKYKYGDVLVSKHMHSVKNIRLQPDEIISRPSNRSTVQVADYLTGVFTKVTFMWNNEFQCNKKTESDPKPRYAKVHCGSVISAPMLVADEKSRDALLKNFPSGAIGGEMEGGVLLEIQNEHNADRARRHDLGVIIIKGVADFGDSQKQEGKQWQYTAALAAVSYIEYKLDMTRGRLFKSEPENGED